MRKENSAIAKNIENQIKKQLKATFPQTKFLVSAKYFFFNKYCGCSIKWCDGASEIEVDKSLKKLLKNYIKEGNHIILMRQVSYDNVINAYNKLNQKIDSLPYVSSSIYGLLRNEVSYDNFNQPTQEIDKVLKGRVISSALRFN